MLEKRQSQGIGDCPLHHRGVSLPNLAVSSSTSDLHYSSASFGFIDRAAYSTGVAATEMTNLNR